MRMTENSFESFRQDPQDGSDHEQCFSKRGLLHGEAVAWGMIASLHLAVARSALTPEQATRIEELTFRLGPFPRFRATAKVLLERTAGDKKHLQSARRFVLPIAIGKAIVVEDVSQQELLAAIQSMLRTMKERGV